MTDDTTKLSPPTDPHHVPVAFCNGVVGSGHLNGVANVTLAVANFTPNAEGKVDTDLVVSARLRMDLYCVRELRDALDRILAENMKPANGTSH